MKQFVLSTLLFAFSFFSKAQTADEVIGGYVKAHGGAEKIKSINTIKMSGSLSTSGMDIGIDLVVSHRAAYRMDIAVPGMDPAFQIYTPVKGWVYLPFQGQTSVRELGEEELKAAQSSLDAHGILVDYQEKGYKAVLQGKEMVEGVACYKLAMESPAGKSNTFFLDVKTFYKVKAIVPTITGGMTEVYYSNYKTTEDGFVFAFSQTNANGTVEFSSIEVNKPVDAAVFKP